MANTANPFTVQPSAKVWGYQEGIDAGLYDPSGKLPPVTTITGETIVPVNDPNPPSGGPNTPLQNWQGNTGNPGQDKFNGWTNYLLGLKPDMTPGPNQGKPTGLFTAACIAAYFIRAVIIILGFILIAAGASKFGGGDYNPTQFIRSKLGGKN